MRFERLILLTFIIAICPAFFFANSQQLNLNYRTLGLKDGLSHTGVLAIKQDSLGFIWLAGFNGLNKYNGYSIKQFKYKKDGHVSLKNRIHDIAFEDIKLWMATEGGIAYFNTQTEAFRAVDIPVFPNHEGGAGQPSFKKVMVDSRGIKWFLGGDKLIALQVTDTGVAIYPAKGLNDYVKNIGGLTFNSIVEDEYGHVWVATSNGFFQLWVSGAKVKLVKHHFYMGRGELPNFIEDIFIAPGNKPVFCLGNYINIAYLTWHNDSTVNFNEDFIVPVPDIRLSANDNYYFNSGGKITIDKSGNFWMVSQGRVVKITASNYILQAKVLTNNLLQNEKYLFASTDFPSLFVDRSNCLFIGSYEDGAIVVDLNQKPFHRISTKPSDLESVFQNRTVSALYADNKNQLWIGTGKGLVVYDLKTGGAKSFSHKAPMPQNYIKSIKSKGNEHIWIASKDGVTVYNTQTEHIQHIASNNCPGINSLLEDCLALTFDNFGRIWCGTRNNGIIVLKPGGRGSYTWQRLHTRSEMALNTNQVHYLLYNNTVHEMYASTNKGFERIKLNMEGGVEDIIHYTVNPAIKHPLSSQQVYPIVKFNDSVYFMGTIGGGLNKVTLMPGKNKQNIGYYKARVYNMQFGLPFNDIEGLVMDHNQNLWLAGKGLVQFNPQNESFKGYNSADGISVDAFKINSFYKHADSTLFFGGINGVTYFNPDNIMPNTYPPRIAITDLYINNEKIIPLKKYGKSIILTKSIAHTNKIVLNYQQKDIGIKFASLHYASPENNKYRYKLIGHDNNWQYPQANVNSISWSNLKYKKYRLEVWGTNNDGLWGKEPAKLSIVIKPPLWKSKLAYVIYGILFLLLVFIVFRYQKNYYAIKNNLQILKIEEKKKEELVNTKLQFFTNVSHEFRTPLTFIISPLQEIKQRVKNPEIRYSLDLSLKYARRLLHLVDQLIQFRKAESGVERLQYSFTEVNTFVTNVTNSFALPARENQIILDLKTSTSPIPAWIDFSKLETILYNLIANAFNALQADRLVEVKVLDNMQVKQVLETSSDFHNIQGFTIADIHYGIMVCDSGKGISEPDMKRIFERFYDIKSTNHLGYGIGLSLVLKLMTVLNGTIHVASKPGKGTRFLLAFGKKVPKENEKASSNAPLHDIMPNNQNEYMPLLNNVLPVNDITQYHDRPKTYSILIVEDNIELANYLKVQLAGKYNVNLAFNGQEGLKAIQKKEPDIIISDVMMDIMNGYEFCQAVKEDMLTCHIPVILLTAKSDPDDKLKGILYGADDYITKPFSINYLSAKVNSILINNKKRVKTDIVQLISTINKKNMGEQQSRFLEKLEQTVEKLMSTDGFCIEKVYRQMGYSRSVFFNKVKEATGVPPSVFIKTTRLKLAVAYLINNNDKINEAATYIGLSPSNFTREFRHLYKKTPGEFLDDIRGE